MNNPSNTVIDYYGMNDLSLWAALGSVVRTERLGALPEEEARNASDEAVGAAWYRRQLKNIKKIYCVESVRQLVLDPKMRDVTVFVASMIDTFAAYFGHTAGTIILVKIYKIGVDRFCDQ